MHCISLAILSRLSRFPSPAVGTNWPFCVDVPLKHQSINQFSNINVCLTYFSNALSMSRYSIMSHSSYVSSSRYWRYKWQWTESSYSSIYMHYIQWGSANMCITCWVAVHITAVSRFLRKLPIYTVIGIIWTTHMYETPCSTKLMIYRHLQTMTNGVVRCTVTWPDFVCFIW